MAEDDKRTDREQTGDRIQAGNIAERAAVALGRGASAEVKVFNLNLPLLPVAVVLLAIIGVLSYLLLRSVKPEEMTGEFNVAVAEFMVVEDDGSSIRSNDGHELGEWLHSRLNSSFAELEIRGYQVWPPDYTGRVSGENREAREQAAEELAQEIGAHVIVYGVITETVDPLHNLEFYVNYKGFEEGEEVVGGHRLGQALPIELPFEESQFQGADNHGLIARVNGLSLLTIGLSYYATDNFERAIQFFSDAAETPGWLRYAGQEVVYLLLGNANVRQASKLGSRERLPTAEDHYVEALDIKPGYARAQLGLANVLYLRALGDPNSAGFDDVDRALLDEAKQAFEEGLEMPDAPDTAHIESKVRFGLGQIYLVRSQLDGAEWLPRAREEFEAVLVAYGGREPSLENLAGHAHARIGSIELLEGDAEAAAERYEQAADLVSPFYQGRYQAQRGDVLASLCEMELALAAYDEAIRTAEFFGDEASAEEYVERQSSLSTDRECP